MKKYYLKEERNCKFCGTKFKLESKHPTTIFCSKKCSGLIRKDKTYEEIYGLNKSLEIKNKWFIGHKVSKETREKISKAFKGKTYEEISGEEFAKIRKQKASEQVKGDKNPFYGKKHKEESRQKQSLLKLGKTHEEIMGKEGAESWYQKMTLENNPRWKGGTSFKGYSFDFSKRFRRAIRKRDNYICMNCGLHQEKTNRTLDVHHIDYSKENAIPENCITLCNSCHAKARKNKDQWIIFFHSILSKHYGYQYSPDGEAIIKLESAKTNE